MNYSRFTLLAGLVYSALAEPEGLPNPSDPADNSICNIVTVTVTYTGEYAWEPVAGSPTNTAWDAVTTPNGSPEAWAPVWPPSTTPSRSPDIWPSNTWAPVWFNLTVPSGSPTAGSQVLSSSVSQSTGTASCTATTSAAGPTTIGTNLPGPTCVPRSDNLGAWGGGTCDCAYVWTCNSTISSSTDPVWQLSSTEVVATAADCIYACDNNAQCATVLWVTDPTSSNYHHCFQVSTQEAGTTGPNLGYGVVASKTSCGGSDPFFLTCMLNYTTEISNTTGAVTTNAPEPVCSDNFDPLGAPLGGSCDCSYNWICTATLGPDTPEAQEALWELSSTEVVPAAADCIAKCDENIECAAVLWVTDPTSSKYHHCLQGNTGTHVTIGPSPGFGVVSIKNQCNDFCRLYYNNGSINNGPPVSNVPEPVCADNIDYPVAPYSGSCGCSYNWICGGVFFDIISIPTWEQSYTETVPTAADCISKCDNNAQCSAVVWVTNPLSVQYHHCLQSGTNATLGFSNIFEDNAGVASWKGLCPSSCGTGSCSLNYS